MPKPKRPVLSPLDRRLRDWLDGGGLRRKVFIQFDGEDFFVETYEGGSSVSGGFYGHTSAAAIRAMLDGQGTFPTECYRRTELLEGTK